MNSVEDTFREKLIDIIDRLNRLEELEILEKREWQKLKEIRNEIAHEYSFNKLDVINSINSVYNISNKLINIYNSTKKFAISRFGI